MIDNVAINIIGEEQCVGCYACIAVCPKKALEMKLDTKGFLKPFVSNACVDCGLCTKVCPVINGISQENSKFQIFGGWSNSENVRIASSSGGLFTEIAENVLSKGGYVAGALWEDGTVKHRLISKKGDLALLRGSKYLQSQDLNVVYSQIKNVIAQGKVVLFSGLPCQVTAIKRMIDSELLLTVSVVCLGIPSFNVFRKHLSEQYPNRKITKVNFRNKQRGWTRFSIEYLEQNSIVDVVEHTIDSFYKLFNSKLIISPACFSCKFNECPRVGDITLGDYWGVEKQFYDSKGVSIIIVSSQRGKRLIDKLVDNNKISVFETSLARASAGNWRINSNQLEKPLAYVDFWNDMASCSLSRLVKKYVKEESFLRRLKRKAKSLMNKQ